MYPTVLVRVVPRWLSDDMSSENPIGADNQQERLVHRGQRELRKIVGCSLRARILRGHTLSSLLKQRDEDMVRAPWRHGEMTVPNYNRPKVAKFLVG